MTFQEKMIAALSRNLLFYRKAVKRERFKLPAASKIKKSPPE